jgi:hypothetical protein
MRWLFLVQALVLTACGPSFVWPGGHLRGTVVESSVSDWSFTDDATVVQLETRPSRPYSIQIWGVGSGSDFYVSSASWRSLLGLGDARWIGHIADDPRVRLRVGERVYEREAVRVRDAEEMSSVLVLYESKYGPGPPVSKLRERLEQDEPESWEGPGVWVFRLDPR